jgi:hypothetical protein
MLILYTIPVKNQNELLKRRVVKGNHNDISKLNAIVKNKQTNQKKV